MKKPVIRLTPGIACKCSCRHYTGSDGKDYWVNLRTNVIYITDCHKRNPIEAPKGVYQILKKK